ncbi:putative DsbA family dithiol-disulfide isomerase [Pseudomonas sp. JUb42]|jgi:predicted DsbA family dithiol-disulfide isomerase|uniref:DsbA family oxidoreductase n=1 Tax=Pseudomonas sp. JUb42 TaxID=2940611 RepID=UPI002168E37A|nr:DsbA family oxidoreductase [Pseudomonas sp. JUb42]MCS3470110.1 putative DsbA family dithiol-disulfide isomerase [Pseudomonas sp. JUb42]
MAKPLKIDFISDISCGWCAVGLRAVEEAIRNIGSEALAEFHFQPFELNPKMPAGGENLIDHLNHKYGPSAAEQYFSATRANGAAVGFEFNLNEDSRIYNTFDAHRLLHWASLTGNQTELSHAFFEAHFTQNRDPSDHDVLLACVAVAQLDVTEAGRVLASNEFGDEVRELEANVEIMGVHAVPTIVINDQYMISGSRSVAAFEQFLRKALNPEP